MDIWTKVFLLNWLAVIVACTVDKYMLKDAIQEAAVIGELFGFWCLLAILSIPAWFAWLIITC